MGRGESLREKSLRIVKPKRESDMDLFTCPPYQPKFDGATYEAKFDYSRLTKQIKRIYDLMKDGKWRTLEQMVTATGDPAASVSAQLRNLRKKQFGSHVIERRHSGDRENGLWEYRLLNG